MAEGMLSGHRVLVVEDDYFLASELEQELAAAGAAVLGPVPSVKAALDLLEHETPDAAVLDVNLGGEMVFPVADALAAGGVPFFFVTGYDRAVLPERHAAARWLSKPVETSATVREFRRLLGAAALAQSGRSEGLRRVVCRPSHVRAAPGPLWPGAGLADRPPL